MSDPITAAVTAALVTQAVEGLSQAGKAAFQRLVQLVRGKLGTTLVPLPPTAQTPTGGHPQVLQAALDDALATDADFAAELNRLWRLVLDDRQAVAGRVANTVTGNVSGTVVQAGDVHGSISFGTPARDATDGS